MVVAFLKSQWFSLIVLCLAIFSNIYPRLGLLVGSVPRITLICTIVIFFILGMGLKSEDIPRHLMNYKIHLLVQACIFILVPVLFAITLPIVAPFLSPSLRIGIIALSCLPTTVSFASTISLIYGGNIVMAIVNSAIANTIGISFVPFILTIFLKGQSVFNPSQDPMWYIILSLLSKTLIPLSFGQLVRKISLSFVNSYKKYFSYIPQFVLLIPILINFSKISQRGNVSVDVYSVTIGFVYIAIMYVLMSLLCYFYAYIRKFNTEDALSFIVLCPQKSLVVGVPFINIYFNGDPNIAVILLPLLFYHPWQIFVINILLPLIKKKLR